uniref:Uncharacterized protein n=1 Tax=Arundo donax TaxID=35708 RepID=A0A0A9G6E3_ARUDO
MNYFWNIISVIVKCMGDSVLKLISAVHIGSSIICWLQELMMIFRQHIRIIGV